MNYVKLYTAIMIFAFLSACTDEDLINPEPQPGINISGLELTISEIGETSAKITYQLVNPNGTKRILYKRKTSDDDYKVVTLKAKEVVLTDLEKSTTYEVKFQVYNNNSTLTSKSYYFTTKSIDNNYSGFYLRSKKLSKFIFRTFCK